MESFLPASSAMSTLPPLLLTATCTEHRLLVSASCNYIICCIWLKGGCSQGRVDSEDQKVSTLYLNTICDTRYQLAMTTCGRLASRSPSMRAAVVAERSLCSTMPGVGTVTTPPDSVMLTPAVSWLSIASL